MSAAQDPSVGRIVHYVLKTHRDELVHRPAVIVHVWPDNGLLQLQVFTDSDHTGTDNDHVANPHWATSVKHDEDGAAGTWHWPERVD